MHPFFERLGGWVLRNNRGHDKQLAWNSEELRGVPDTITLESPAFANKGRMPQRFAGRGEGQNISPPLKWSGIPAKAKELFLIVEDADAPVRKPIIHAIVAGIPPNWPGVEEGALHKDSLDVRVGVAAFDQVGYFGPRPTRAHGVHRYFFQLVALGEPITADTIDAFTVITAAGQSALAKGLLIGTYEMK